MRVPYLSINPSYISCYERNEGSCSLSQAQIDNQKHLKDNKPDPDVSYKAAKRLRSAIDWLLTLAFDKKVYDKKQNKTFMFKLCFATLTLSSKQNHSDLVIKKELLNHFLLIAKRKWQVVHYIWRAEAQRNGNIHFHIIFDRFIPYNELRSVWNSVQDKLGYVRAFSESTGKSDPNSTDIHSLKKVRNLSAYLSEYVSKKQTNRLIEGNLWGLSYSLSNCKPLRLVRDWIITDELVELVDAYKARWHKGEYCQTLYVKCWDWLGPKVTLIKKYWDEHVLNLNLRFSDQNLFSGVYSVP